MSIFDLPSERTTIEPLQYPFSINYETPLFFTGSCFVETIGNLMKQLRFKTLVNPFGTLYNPVSIYDSLNRVAHNTVFEESDLQKDGEQFFSYDTNTTFRHNGADTLLSNLNTVLQNAHSHFKQSHIVFITLGTAFVFRRLETQTIVANCQKQPASLFINELLDLQSVTDTLRKIITLSHDKKIVFTVSPIRHLKNGLTGNARSKALLLTAIHELVDNKTVFYFPSYEIMIDDLRDYRYYDSSLTHLSETAKQYVFHHFASAFFDNPTTTLAKRLEKFNKQWNHRPINNILQHYIQLKQTIKKLQQDYPFLSFEEELTEIKKKQQKLVL